MCKQSLGARRGVKSIQRLLSRVRQLGSCTVGCSSRRCGTQLASFSLTCESCVMAGSGRVLWHTARQINDGHHPPVVCILAQVSCFVVQLALQENQSAPVTGKPQAIDVLAAVHYSPPSHDSTTVTTSTWDHPMPGGIVLSLMVPTQGSKNMTVTLGKSQLINSVEYPPTQVHPQSTKFVIISFFIRT